MQITNLSIEDNNWHGINIRPRAQPVGEKRDRTKKHNQTEGQEGVKTNSTNLSPFAEVTRTTHFMKQGEVTYHVHSLIGESASRVKVFCPLISTSYTEAKTTLAHFTRISEHIGL